MGGCTRSSTTTHIHVVFTVEGPVRVVWHDRRGVVHLYSVASAGHRVVNTGNVTLIGWYCWVGGCSLGVALERSGSGGATGSEKGVSLEG